MICRAKDRSSLCVPTLFLGSGQTAFRAAGTTLAPAGARPRRWGALAVAWGGHCKKKKAKGLAGTVPVSSPPGTGGGPRSGVSPLLWHSRGAGSSRCITHPRWWAKDRGKITSHPISFGFGVVFFSPFPLALELCAEPRLFKVGFVLFF